MTLPLIKSHAVAFYPLDGTTSADEASLVSGATNLVQNAAPASRSGTAGRGC